MASDLKAQMETLCYCPTEIPGAGKCEPCQARDRITALEQEVARQEGLLGCAEAGEAKLRLRIKGLEQEVARKDGLLERAKRQLTYPVATEIKRRGYNFRTDDDTLQFVLEHIDAALEQEVALKDEQVNALAEAQKTSEVLIQKQSKENARKDELLTYAAQSLIGIRAHASEDVIVDMAERGLQSIKGDGK